MDKNMINIDDLFAQRLAGGEEEERAGAWANMKSLLDDKMPVRTPVAFFNWRRTVTIVTGVVLLAAVAVGGYEKFTSFRNDASDKTIASSAAGSNTITPANTSTPKANTSNTITNAPATSVSGNNSKTVVSANNKTTQSSKVTANKTTSGKVITKSVNADLSTSTGKLVANSSATGNTKSTSNNTKINESKSNNNKDNGLISNNKNTTNNSSASGENNKPQHSGNNGTPVPQASNNTAANNNSNNKPGKNDINQQPVDNKNKAGNNTTTDKDNTAKNDKLFKDSVKMIETKEKYSVKEGWKRDTVKLAKVARFDVVPVDPSKATRLADIIPGANMASQMDEKYEPLESKRVSTKRINTGIAPSRFEEMVKTAKFNLAKVTFHTGLIGGVNSSIAGSNTTMGIQMGLFGVANMGEHWSMFAELKYQQRWGGSNVITDNYNNNKYETPAAHPGYIEHTWDSVEHSFKYPTLNSVHIPVSVRYAVKRFTMFCGADFAYNFAVNAEEIQQQKGIRVSQVTPLTAEGLRYDNEKTRPGITYKDFSSRFDIGGMVGMSYNLAPSTMLDVRVIQSMWNNAKTAGEIKVFEELYSRPSVQFNLSYRFGNNKFKAYRR